MRRDATVAGAERRASRGGTADHARVRHPAASGAGPGALVPQRAVPRAQPRLPAGVPRRRLQPDDTARRSAARRPVLVRRRHPRRSQLDRHAPRSLRSGTAAQTGLYRVDSC